MVRTCIYAAAAAALTVLGGFVGAGFVSASPYNIEEVQRTDRRVYCVRPAFEFDHEPVIVVTVDKLRKSNGIGFIIDPMG